MIKRIWAALTGGTLVLLTDYDGEVTLAIARKQPSGALMAERMWPFKIQEVMLLSDGTIRQPSYVSTWKYVKEPQDGL